MSKSKFTPGPWVKDRLGMLVGSNGARVYVYDAGLAMVMASPAEEHRANSRLIAAAPEMREALGTAAEHLNSLNSLVVKFLTGKVSEKDFISGCIEMSDGPERKACAKAMNAAMNKADGEPS